MSIEVYANKFLEKVVKSYGFLNLFHCCFRQYTNNIKVKALYWDLMS